MHSESFYWKEPLLKRAKQIRRLIARRKQTESTLARVEQHIVFGCFAVRKLLQTPGKITDELSVRPLKTQRFPNLRRVDWLSSHRIRENYDLSSAAEFEVDIPFFCGRIIHAFSFDFEFRESGGLEAILFTSDIDKDKWLHRVSLLNIVCLFRDYGNCYPSSIRWSRARVGFPELIEVQ